MVGCGGGGQSTPASCLQVQPCGGDVVGTWSFLGACTDVEATNDLSDCSLLSGATETLTGRLTFNADGTYTATNWRDTFATTETAPLSCFGAATCAASNGTSTDSSNGETATLTVNCSGTSTCVCQVSGSRTLTTASGNYSVVSTGLSVSGGPLPSGFAYCVEENRLHLMRTVEVVTTNPPSDRNVILSDIVAQRQ
jgi:hypothetical protein